MIKFIILQFLGGFCNSLCIVLLPFGLILALNRLIIFSGQTLSYKTQSKIFNTLIWVSIIWSSAFFILYMTPFCGIAFREYAWHYDTSLKLSPMVQRVDVYVTFPMLFCTLFIYLIICAIMVIRVRIFVKYSNEKIFTTLLIIKTFFLITSYH